jgi:transposase
MDKEHNEIGKDVVRRSKTTKACPRCDEPEVLEDESTIQEIEDPLPKVREVISDIKMLKLI